jgi:DNA polymerase IV (DinB-like DNA polymerase)
MTNNNRIILHVDMDSFFASIEMRENPDLTGKPVIVGADPKGGKGRGVVSTCSYEARKFGIRSGMPITRAYKHCPNAVFLPVNFPLYIKVSDDVMNILRRYAEKSQQVSIDEAYLDVSSTGSFEAAGQLALEIKREIMEMEKLTCSIGVGPSKVVAKIASDYKKPDGLTLVEPSMVEDFLSPLPVRKIPGIGKKTEALLKVNGIETIGELAEYDIQKLISNFGKWGIYMHDLASGIDESEVREEKYCKSISRELTFEEDTDDINILNRTIEELAEAVQKTLVQEGFLFKTLTIKVRYKGFETRTRARTLEHFTDDLNIIKNISKMLLKLFFVDKKIRLVGIRLSNLEKRRARQRSIEEFAPYGL